MHRLLDDQQERLERAHTEFPDWWTPPLVETLRAGFKSLLGKRDPPSAGANPHITPERPESVTPRRPAYSPHFNIH